MNILIKPWPWYIAGPLIGLIIPLLLLAGNKPFGVSVSFRHISAALFKPSIKYFDYNWKDELWNLNFVLGIIIGAIIAGLFLQNPNPVEISQAAIESIEKLGVKDFTGLIPTDVFNFSAILTLRGFLLMIVGGFLVGFGTQYAGGCTSGHTIMGLSNLQFPSLVATCCFFAGGVIMTFFILPYIMYL